MNAIHRGLYAYPPGRTDEAGAGPRRRRAGDLRGRQDRHGEAQEGRHVLQAGQPRGRGEGRQVRDRARVHGQRRRTATPASTWATSMGAPKEPGDYQEIPGIETPDKHTIVFKLTKGTGAAARGRARRCRSRSRSRRSSRRSTTRRPRRRTAPRPRSTPARTWSSPTRRARRSATWPARRIDLVRNPDYAPVDDFRPAYLDEIEFQAGNEDTAVATRRILTRREPGRRRHRAARAAAQDAAARATSRSSRRCRAVAGA